MCHLNVNVKDYKVHYSGTGHCTRLLITYGQRNSRMLRSDDTLKFKGRFTRNVCIFRFSLIIAVLFLKMQTWSVNTITCCRKTHSSHWTQTQTLHVNKALHSTYGSVNAKGVDPLSAFASPLNFDPSLTLPQTLKLSLHAVRSTTQYLMNNRQSREVISCWLRKVTMTLKIQSTSSLRNLVHSRRRQFHMLFGNWIKIVYQSLFLSYCCGKESPWRHISWIIESFEISDFLDITCLLSSGI